MAKWTATNIEITKSERLLPGGNKAVDYSFVSTILRDGVEHHKYNEASFGGSEPAATVQQIILSHLRVWEGTDALTTKLSVPDVEFERTAPPQPSPEELQAQAIAVEIGKLRTIKDRVELGLSESAELDAQIAAVRDLEAKSASVSVGVKI